MKPLRLIAITFLLAAGPAIITATAENVPVQLIAGMDDSGHPVHPPIDSPAAAWTSERPWNVRSVRFNDATNRLAFEAYDLALLGGSRRRSELDQGDTRRRAGPIADTVFTAATAENDPINADKTRELYITEADGSGGICLGCKTMTDGQDGIVIVSAPSANGTGHFRRETAAKIYAVQNKDHAAWWPNGDWITGCVEMPVHAGQHGFACAGTGAFTDIWAIYVRRGDPRFGKIWVRLTDWVRGWERTGLYDDIAMAPYDSGSALCPAGRQYARTPTDVPFAYFHCSPPGEPPPVSGVMRPTISPSLLADGNALIIWGAKVGFLRPSGASPLLLGRAELHLAPSGVEGMILKLPTFVDYLCPFAPTAAHPDGIGTYKGRKYPGKLDLVGQVYEPREISPDNLRLVLASDAFASGRPGPGRITVKTFEFMDVIEYATDGSRLTDLTAYNPSIGYGYPLNGYPPPMDTWGFWEESAVYITWRGRHYMAFASNAGYPKQELSLDTWLMDLDHPRIKQITTTNDPAQQHPKDILVPGAFDPRTGILYIYGHPMLYSAGDPKKDPTGYGANALAPGNLSVMRLGEALDRGLMN